MRKVEITIHQSDSDRIKVSDEVNDEEFDDYCNKLSELMKMSHIAILKTNKTTLLVRPSKITGIKIEDKKLEQTIKVKDEKDNSSKNEEEDIITDVD